MSAPENIEIVRSRLASRQSFFGGPVSTRELSVAPKWRDLPSAKAVKSTDGKPRSRGTVGKAPLHSTTLKTDKYIDPAEKKRMNRDFSDLNAPSQPLAASGPTAKAAGKKLPPLIPKRGQGNSGKTEGKGNDAASAKETLAEPRAMGTKSDPRLSTAPTMQRHVQMTSLGPQTVQLVRMKPKPAVDAKSPSSARGTRHLSPRGPPANKPAGLFSEQNIAAIRRQKAAQAVKQQSQPKQRLKGTFYGAHQPPAARRRVRTVDDESASDLDSFIEDNDDEADEGAVEMRSSEWKSELREVLGGYDPTKYASIDAQPDYRMHATYNDIAAEEARAGKIAREIDRREAEREAAEREAKLKRKQERLKRKLEGGGNDSSTSSLEDSSEEEDEDEDHGSSDDDEEELDEEERRARKRRRRMKGFIL